MSQTKRAIGPLEQRFNNIVNSRTEINLSHAGEKIRCKISGEPKLGYYDPKLDALKDLYSFNIRKAPVLDSTWFAEQHANAIALEQSGNSVDAEKAFNELLNACQLTFGVINRDATKRQFFKDELVDVVVNVVDVQEKDANGNPTGKTHKAIVAESIIPVASTVLTKSKRFGADIEEPVAAPAAASEELAAITK